MIQLALKHNFMEEMVIIPFFIDKIT